MALQAQAPSNMRNSSSNSSLPKSFADQQLELQIQRAIELSLSSNPTSPSTDSMMPPPVQAAPGLNSSQANNSNVIREDDLALAIRLSQQEEEEKRKREEEEDVELKKILELSLKEK